MRLLKTLQTLSHLKSVAAPVLIGLLAGPLHGQTTIIGASTNNGDLETGLLAPWDDSNNAGLAAISTAYAHTGAYSLTIDSTGAGEWSSPEVRQADFPASEGDVWEFSGYILTPVTIGDASFGILKIVFQDSGGNDLIPTESTKGYIESNPGYPGIETTPRVTSASTAEEWVFVEAAGTAPAGTAKVLVLALNVNQAVAPGVMHFDDLVATQTTGAPPAEPPPPQVIIEPDGPDLLLTYETDKTLEYTTEFSVNLSGWVPLGTFSGTDEPQTIRIVGGIPAPGLQSFFQVVDGPLSPALGDVLVNGNFSEGDDLLDGWEAFAVWEQPKGTAGFQSAWTLADVPVVAPGDDTATFAMNTQLAADDPSWEGAYQNAMSFQQAFWTPDGPLTGNVVNLYGQVVTFAGDIEITQAYTMGAIANVSVVSSTILPAEAGQTYTGVVPFLTDTGLGCTFDISRDGTGAVSTVKIIDPGNGFTTSSGIYIKGSLLGGEDNTDDVLLMPSDVADSTAEVFIEFLDNGETPTPESIVVDVTSQGPGPVPFSLSATCPVSSLNVVIVGFRHRGVEGTNGQIQVSNLSLIAADP